jgi:hypothetical protein
MYYDPKLKATTLDLLLSFAYTNDVQIGGPKWAKAMSDKTSRDGNCWLCGKYRLLTEEHVPPKAAFNKYPLLLEEVSKRTQETGILVWEQGSIRQRGFTVRSLCASCNSTAGTRFAPPYIEFVKTVAERVANITVRHQLTIQKIKKPQLILKQVIQQFVTTNGSTFVQANQWVRPFLKKDSKAILPPDVFVYLFATNTPSIRTTGISGHVYADRSQFHIVSEFTFWPIGTVMSFGELPLAELAPIHQWCKLPYQSKQTADITLCVNPTESTLPVDFRSKDQIESNRFTRATSSPKESLVSEMGEQVSIRSGKGSDDNYIFTAHPSQVDLMRKQKE